MAALVFAAYVVLAGVMLHHRHGDPASFIVAGENFAARDSLVSPIPVIAKSPGYDGQFYYRLALNPFTSKPTDYGITLDDPATRGARIGYPFLAWLVSFGEPRLLPWALILVNLAGLFAIAWASVGLVWARGLPFWLGLGAPFYPGFIISLWRDTTEIVAGGFEMAALNLACRRRFWWAAAPACCALVTRETSLLTLSGFGVAEAATCLRRRQWSWNLVPLALPAAVHVAWQAFVAWHWNRPSYISLTKGPVFSVHRLRGLRQAGDGRVARRELGTSRVPAAPRLLGTRHDVLSLDWYFRRAGSSAPGRHWSVANLLGLRSAGRLFFRHHLERSLRLDARFLRLLCRQRDRCGAIA